MNGIENPPFLPTPQSQTRFSLSARLCRCRLNKLHKIRLVPVRVWFVHAQVGVQVQFWRFDDADDQVCHALARHHSAFEWRVACRQFVVDFVFVRHPGWAHDNNVKAMSSRPAKPRMTHCAICPPVPSINIFSSFRFHLGTVPTAGSYKLSLTERTHALKKAKPRDACRPIALAHAELPPKTSFSLPAILEK